MSVLARPLRILLLEDSEFDAELEIRELRKSELPFVWERVQTRTEFEKALQSFSPDVILVDFKLPDFDGAEALAIARKVCPDVPAIIVTGAVGEDTAVNLLKSGAVDFLLKDRVVGRLVGVVERAVAESANRLARRLSEEQQAQLNADLRKIATHDPLTGVASRTLLMEKLHEAVSAVRPQQLENALFSIDINRFRQFNVTYGVPFGDQILLEVARRLSAICRDRDLVANFGSDRFYLLIRRPGLESGLPALMKEIQGIFTRPFRIWSREIGVDASMGGVVLKNPGDTPLQVLNQCDEAMRRPRADSSGEILMMDDVMIRELKKRTLMDEEISDAAKHKAFFYLFQPIVTLSSGKISGAEALLRYRRMDGVVLTAADFMGNLVRTNSLAYVDENVISHFFSDEATRLGSMLDKQRFSISFNISPGILANVGYADQVLAQIKHGGAEPSSFTLEILEEGLMPSNGAVRQNLATLRKAGVRIAVDDFGTGYSNLKRLAHLKIDLLKIPRDITSGICSGEPELESLVEASLGIAKSLGLEVVAEGVEKKEEAERLRDMGCQYAQGYFYGKAMKAEELLALLKKQGN